MKSSEVIYLKGLPKPSALGSQVVLIYDSVLLKNSVTKSWINSFSHKISVSAGESLKSLKQFESVLNKITNLPVAKTTNLTFVGLGGGSVGDFVGFLASVYMRGRPLILIPSTWLSAIDSAHGGKTALNTPYAKNQIGTFYPAQKIFICEQLLKTQPQVRMTESMGELIKIAILNDPQLFKKLQNDFDFYSVLPLAIKNKYKIINKDPKEQSGVRRLLNLGHTLGHVIESNMKWPHGLCVLLGMQFSLRWSFNKKIISEKEFVKISELIEQHINAVGLEGKNLKTALTKLSEKQVAKSLNQDKKIVSQNLIDFIFIKKVGQCFREKVTVAAILAEIKRQKSFYV